MRRISLRAGIVCLTAVAALALPAGSASAARAHRPAPPTVTLATTAAPTTTTPQVALRFPRTGRLTSVTTGRHATYDRIVFTTSGSLPGWSVRYSGWTPTGATLKVTLVGVTAHRHGRTTVSGLPLRPQLPSVSRVALTSDRYGVTTFAVTTPEDLPFRVFGLTNPTRVVLDVAHPAVTPFTTAFTTLWGTTGGDFTLTAVRTARHATYDRVTFDLTGSPLAPNVGAGYAASNDPMEHHAPTTVLVRLWTFTHGRPGETAVASYHGATVVPAGLPAVRSLRVVRRDPSTIDVLVDTTARHGVRVFTVPDHGTTHVVLDVLH